MDAKLQFDDIVIKQCVIFYRTVSSYWLLEDVFLILNMQSPNKYYGWS